MGSDFSRRNPDQAHLRVTRVLNNQHPLKFHSVHGENITLANNHSTARRFEGFCKGIVFSHRPVAINEHVYIKFLDISTSWSGALRIGFTSNDPSTYRNRLPKYACPYMTDSNGNWARALAERLVKENSILFYYINSDGDVHYGFDNVERGIFFSGVNVSGRLWALLDIYGNTVEIQFMNPHHLFHDPQNEIAQNARFSESVLITKEIENYLQVVIPPVHFHEVHGRHVAILKNGKIYEKLLGDNGYTFTNRPLNVGEAVIMHLFDIDSTEAHLIFGLTSCNPSELRENLPDDPDLLVDRSEYWVVQGLNDSVSSFDTLVFVIGVDGALMFRKNLSTLLAAAYVDHTLPLWFFVNLCKSKGKIAIAGSYEGIVEDYVIDFAVEKLAKTTQLYGDSLLKEPPSNDSNSECVVCMEAPKNCALYRCGHACMCYACAEQLWHSRNPQCPVCREDIQDVIKIFK